MFMCAAMRQCASAAAAARTSACVFNTEVPIIKLFTLGGDRDSGAHALLASHSPSPSAAVAAAWRGRGRVPIAGWSYGGVGPERGLWGGGRREWCEEWARRG